MVQCLRLRLPTQGTRVQYLAGELRSHMLQGQKTKTQNRSNIVTNSTKTLKKNDPHSKKIFLKKLVEYISEFSNHIPIYNSAWSYIQEIQ